MRQMQSGGNKALSFGKSKAKLSSSAQKKVTFKDVAGVDEAKDELQEIIEFLREPQKFQKLGGRIPKGVLLMGPPGTGKTLMARAVAGEANVPFFSISGSDFVEMFVGVGASRVRDLFEQGKKNAPCIVFIDEIDAVGRHRGAGLGGGHDEREQTLNQLLVEMDGFESNEGVILVAATNRPDVLDPALLRPGRFDRRIVVNRPDVKGREGILAVHTKKIPLSDDVDVAVLARGTSGFSGADLANLVNEAALSAARYNQKVVRMADFEFAKDKVLMGAERRSMIISENEKRITAIHESGHALLAAMLPHADPIHKVTIIPRGMALGLTTMLPIDEKHNYSRDYLRDQICILLGGRIAEEITLGSITTGAGNDLERATDLARKMVCEWGMSDSMGPLTFGKKEEQIFLGREIAQHQDYSEDTALKIDHEVKRFVTDAYSRAQTILMEHKPRLIEMAEALLSRETLDAEQVRRIVAGEALDDPAPATPPATPTVAREPKAKERPAASIVPPLPPRTVTQE
jgi:cell division protease FtsH